MGLRESKKRKVRAAIIENAISLFRENGFEATTVKQICSSCELSEATFFNYFSTKSGVLSAWAHNLVEAQLEGLPVAPDRGLRPSLRTLCAELARVIEADVEFARSAWGKATLPAHPPEAAEQLLRAGQESGHLRRDLSARQMGAILYVSLCGTIADWLERPPPRGPLVSDLRRATDLLLDGSRRRNERVRPVARASGLSTR